MPSAPREPLLRRSGPCRPGLSALAILWLFVPAVASQAQVFVPDVVTEVRFEPGLVTELDRPRITAVGRSVCTVSPNGTRITEDGVQLLLDFDCPPPGSDPERRFEASFELPLLPWGDTTLEVLAPLNDDEYLLFETPFTVYGPGAIILETPKGLILDDEPATLRVRWYGELCGGVESTSVDGNVLRIDMDTACFVTPPIVGAFSQPVEVGPLPAGEYEVHLVDRGDIGAFSRLTVYDADGCLPSATELCLNGNRFRASVTWSDFQGARGAGIAVPVRDRDDTGMFWFFNQNNVELTVKVLDGCGVNGHYWVFISPGSTVDWTVEITDTLRGETRTWSNGLGNVPSLIPATDAFPTCP